MYPVRPLVHKPRMRRPLGTDATHHWIDARLNGFFQSTALKELGINYQPRVHGRVSIPDSTLATSSEKPGPSLYQSLDQIDILVVIAWIEMDSGPNPVFCELSIGLSLQFIIGVQLVEEEVDIS